jgi:hypothetical protein
MIEGANRKLSLAAMWMKSRLFVEVRLVAMRIEIHCVRKSGLISVLLEPKGATQAARFTNIDNTCFRAYKFEPQITLRIRSS